MPLKDLLNAIEAEATSERERLEADSKAEAAAIVAAAREEAERARGEILRAQAPATGAEADRRLALARLEASRLEREARRDAFDELLSEARALLAGARREPGYRDALGALLSEALAALPDASTARVHPDDEALLTDLARGADLAVVPDAAVGGGVVLESPGGRVVRNTLPERLANAEPGLRPWYGARLEALAPRATPAGTG